ncbi:GNAT family N-acetyltransferase [Intrasporangium calvum]|uniref:GCN5-related N-acetyltransferase n=1 Tax=Intrasporangium calvum (strain ATCC 23552 / DSM 43043 / JCM 3097 / NBRC 12989 / NCIMB 10167 / NRRL B-3866 / 7 KIP) TaxID=710696 RepID=E6SG14_INTC7|nr:GCN5-related N-acetyltransferase [Intrasporangium calvum DSM 43043]
MRIRPAQLDELEELAWIEHEADGLFGVVGVDVILDAPAPPTADYAKAQEAGSVLVAELPTGPLAGFVRTEIVDETAHLEQVSVLPQHARHGVGRAMIAAAEDWAFRRGHTPHHVDDLPGRAMERRTTSVWAGMFLRTTTSGHSCVPSAATSGPAASRSRPARPWGTVESQRRSDHLRRALNAPSCRGPTRPGALIAHLSPSSRAWLIEHNGEPLPDQLVAEIVSVAGAEPNAQWWGGPSLEGRPSSPTKRATGSTPSPTTRADPSSPVSSARNDAVGAIVPAVAGSRRRRPIASLRRLPGELAGRCAPGRTDLLWLDAHEPVGAAGASDTGSDRGRRSGGGGVVRRRLRVRRTRPHR